MSVIRERIVALYGADVLRKSAINIRGGAGVFEKVLSGKGYKTALEIGTYRGCAAAEISQYVERVVTIDLVQGKLEGQGEAWDRAAFWNSLGVENIEFHAVADNVYKTRLIDSLEFDFAFIDGAHDRSVRLDFDLVRRCGRVLFHDYERRGVKGQDDVCDFVDSLPKSQVQVLDIFALWTNT